MKASRRSFFGLVAAPVVTKALPVAAAPMVEMVEADIAPVAIPFNELFSRDVFTTQDVALSISDYMESYVRPQMLRLSREIDAEIRKALYG